MQVVYKAILVFRNKWIELYMVLKLQCDVIISTLVIMVNKVYK